MGRINIKKLTVSGEKGISEIEFGKNLTIIAGPSDTGKSYIYRSIEYLFGKETGKIPFETNIGYDTLKMDLETSLGSITISRAINSSNIRILKTTIKGIDSSKVYSVFHESENPINEIFLKILGVPEKLKVPSKESCDFSRFTWNNLRQLFLINEDRTQKEGTIILPEYQQTLFLSCLLYILYEQDFSQYNIEEQARITKLKNQAISEYISGKKIDIDKRKQQINSICEKYETNSIEEIIDNVKKQVEEIQSKINSVILESTKVAKEIIDTEKKIQEDNLVLNRYSELETQYVSDVNRLSFIVESEEINENNKENNCPFCNNKLNHKTNESYVDIAVAELHKSLNNINSLDEVKNDLSDNISKSKEVLEDLRIKKDALDMQLNKHLIPEKDSLLNNLEQYQYLIKINEELKVLETYSETFDIDLQNLDKVDKKPQRYKPKELFPEDFYEEIENNYLFLLKQINYKPAYDVAFDRRKFDVIINGKSRNSHGKGYRALFNSLLILAIRMYINKYARINPHLYFIDSPLHDLQVGENDINTEDNVRKGFFNYLINNYNDDQIIIIENTNDHDIPNMFSNDPNIKVIKFTQKEEIGRYGFLDNVKKG